MVTRRHARLISVRFIALISCMSIAAGLLIVFRRAIAPLPFRQTLLVVDGGSLLHVVSFDAKRRQVTVIALPRDLVIEGAFGYGPYTVGSLAALDAIDRKNGELITKSVGNAIGVPVEHAVFRDDALEGSMSPDMLRRVFSPWQRFTVPWIDWMRLVFLAARVSVDGFHLVDISASFFPFDVADGSVGRALNESRLDYLLDDALYDAGLRSEGLSVAVYNATDIPAMGNRLSRAFGRVGIKLIEVGNSDRRDVLRCELTGSASATTSLTARFILHHFSCDVEAVNESSSESADLRLYLGQDVARVYQ